MNIGNWYYERCDRTDTWDVSFGTPGKGLSTIECRSEDHAKALTTLMNDIQAVPTNLDTTFERTEYK